jgi:hypothetical protein
MARETKGGRWAAEARVRFVARERENVAQEGFDAVVHRAFPAVPAVSLGDSPFAVESPVAGAGHRHSAPLKLRSRGR